ncbi:MAG: beta-phosphoglucomutase, partial [Kiritimatiellia bacterium]
MDLKCVIFDLDGVLVDTSVFHAKAWADLVRSEGYEPPADLEDLVKGISRMESLKIALGAHVANYSAEELEALAARKNACYLEAAKAVQASDLYPGARDLLDGLRRAGIKIALGSASKNARAVLDGLGITGDFDVISDGTTHQRGKPHPDVFLGAAWMAGVTPQECIVVEDAPAGITAALRGGFVSVGLGPVDFLDQAHLVVDSLTELDVAALRSLHASYRIPELKGAPELPSLTVSRTADFIPGDGQAAWDGVPWMPLQALEGENAVVPSTRMKMLYSDAALYVLVEGDAKTIQCTLDYDGAPLYTEDVVELFLMPDPWQRLYLEYELSPLGYDVTLRVANHLGTFTGCQPWLGGATHGVRKHVVVRGGEARSGATISGWKMEMMVPFVLFESIACVAPSAGTVWYGNVCRIDHEAGKKCHMAWSRPRGASFH